MRDRRLRGSAFHGVVSTGASTPESCGFSNPETTPLSIPTNPATYGRRKAVFSAAKSLIFVTMRPAERIGGVRYNNCAGVFNLAPDRHRVGWFRYTIMHPVAKSQMAKRDVIRNRCWRHPTDRSH